MGGSTKKIDTTPTDITGLRSQLSSWLMNGSNPTASFQGGQGMWNAPQGPPQMYTAPGANSTPQGFNGGPGIGNGGQSPMMFRPPPGMQFGGPPPRADGLDQRAIDADPQGFAQWQARKAAFDAQQGGAGAGGFAQDRSNFAPGIGSGTGEIAGGGGSAGGASRQNWQQDWNDPRFRASGGGRVAGMSGMSMDGDPNPIQPNNPGSSIPTGGAPPGTGGFNNMFANPRGGPTQLGPVATVSAPGQINPAQIDPNSIPQLNAQQIRAQQLNPNQFNPMGSYQAVGTQFGVSQAGADPFSRGQVRDVGAGAASFNPTMSVDQLGGANSAFFQNMQNQLRPAFDQSRKESLAAAMEGLGNMGAGSALANSLGTAMNRSLGAEQAQLANYAAQGLQTEVQRQMAESQLGAQVSMSNADRFLRGDMANQGADAQFLNTLINQGQVNGQLGLEGQRLGLQGQIANQGTMAQLGMAGANNALQASQGNQTTDLSAQGQNAVNQLNAGGQNQNAWMQAMLANMGANNNAQAQNIANSMNSQQFNASALNQSNMMQGQLGQAWNQMVNQMGEANAQRYMQMLLGMSTTGVGPAQLQHNPGWGGMVGGIIGTGIGALAGGVGAGIGGRLGSAIGGGSTPTFTTNPFNLGR